MKTLVIGQGGREHALAKALHLSNSVTEVHAVPGSDGIASVALCHKVNLRDHQAILDVVRRHSITEVIIGPEDPLVDGLADVLRSEGILVFGPSQAAAQLEGSKVFAKEFMKRAGVPTAEFSIVRSVKDVLQEVDKFTPPYVLKADGLAGGKGVAICEGKEELLAQAKRFFEDRIFGDAGESALLEQFQPGWELSYHIITNGEDFEQLPLAQDHKRIGEGDTGPNTGGMGTVSPLNIDSELRKRIVEEVMKPTVAQLKKEDLFYRGVIFVGLMITSRGPTVIEYNVRFGDPETQVMFPLLDGDWGDVFREAAQGKISPLSWKPVSAACVVLAAKGYPDSPERGAEISGNPGYETSSGYFLHAGTKKEAGKWSVNGGRVLNAIGMGSNLQEAVDSAYKQAAEVSWDGMQIRKDIGKKVL